MRALFFGCNSVATARQPQRFRVGARCSARALNSELDLQPPDATCICADPQAQSRALCRGQVRPCLHAIQRPLRKVGQPAVDFVACPEREEARRSTVTLNEKSPAGLSRRGFVRICGEAGLLRALFFLSPLAVSAARDPRFGDLCGELVPSRVGRGPTGRLRASRARGRSGGAGWSVT